MSYSTPGWSASREVRIPWSQIAPWARISTTCGVAQRQIGQPLRDRRQPATSVDQDRHAGLLGDREDALELVSVERERLSARVQLDPACPRRQAALGLGDGLVEGVQPAEGDQPALALPRPGEHAVVGNAV